jgi:hypothetical protein
MRQTVSLAIEVKRRKVKPLTDFLKSVDINVVELEKKQVPDARLEKGTFQEGEKIAQFAGAWQENPNRLSADEIRKQAWQRKSTR